MHYLHLIAVEAENQEDAVSEAEGAIEDYGDGRVWDYYDSETDYFGDKPALCFSGEPEHFREELDRIGKERDDELQKCLDRLSGRSITATDAPDHLFGLPVGDKAVFAERRSEGNRKYSEMFKRLLGQGSVALDDNEKFEIGLVLWNTSRWLTSDYTSDSMFYDGVEGTPEMSAIETRCKEKPDQQWLVAIDLHN